ncbi:Transcriptional regulator, TetR family [Pseudonocardia sp. Ae717_Ps2]|uniref:TetR/AcrR family transcriptional regulator n=1 Tax=Pseudonocardia sp. Ae717_Ps2 TaxID=1885573 RepID=UPI00094B3A01|nr:TetR family transcriptional regulator [Pseudonocardia sp. Ae717_Ps2]OLM31443.1 Transcriptional regulator, TetR family [Pseudonocardia sp. Ae717_Ps2]
MAEQAAPGRRERKKAATRAALAGAALRLCSARGLDAVTVEQIADAADVAPRTFFNYFTSKEEAVVAANESAADTLLTAFTARPDDEPVTESLRHALRAVVTDPGYLDRVQALRGHPTIGAHQLAVFAAQERALAEAVVTRTGSDPARDLYPTLAAAAAVTGLRVAVQHWLGDHGVDPRSPTLPQLVDEVMAVFDAGLRALAGVPA